MDLASRKVVDRYFTAFGFVSISLMGAALVVLLGPIVYKGMGAMVFQGTIEFRRLHIEQYGHGDAAKVAAQDKEAAATRRPVYRMLEDFQKQLDEMSYSERSKYRKPFGEIKTALHELLGPLPGESMPILLRGQYGQTRWDRAQVKLQNLLYSEQWDYSDPSKPGVKVLKPRADAFKGTALEPLFDYVPKNLHAMLLPQWTFYWRFLFDSSTDAHFFGGIWPELLGTIYLTIGSMVFALPMGIIAAIFLVEYSKESLFLSLLNTCISTLAGVPSIVFGLFGLAFFINTLHVSESKSALAGSLTLALLVLPTVIRASEEALRSVPHTYREAALSLGASKWHMIMSVIVPAALPGILTSIVISMGRAAGETAPIIFTAAVSVGKPLSLLGFFNQPTPALPWNIYNVATEHEAVQEIRHVQFGMVLVLVALVLLLNTAAIVLRARIAKKLKG